MAVIIDMHKAIRRIKMDDSPDSPEFTLDLTDEGMQTKAVPMAGASTLYAKVAADMQAGAPTEQLQSRVAAIYRTIVDVMLGQGAFDTILEWTTDGMDVNAEQVTMAFAPLIVYLMTEYEQVLTANRNKAVARYLDVVADANAI